MTPDKEDALIRLLRDEATKVKDCFNQYSFQALALSGVAFGVIARCQMEYPFVGLISIPIIILLFAVSRIGLHKYATANRTYGYQLHLERIKKLTGPVHKSRIQAIDDIGWEEAMCAWRVVQATVFEEIYSTDKFGVNRVKEAAKDIKYKWFEPKTLVQKPAAWHPGSYLGNMLGVLHITACLSLLPLFYLCVQLGLRSDWVPFGPIVAITFIFSVFVCIRIWSNRIRRQILESGLLSIHSCAIMWHAVVIAHYRAILLLGGNNTGKIESLEKYTKTLSMVVLSLRKDIGSIHSWVNESDTAFIERMCST